MRSAGDTSDEDRWIAAARSNGASAADIAAFQRQLTSAQAKAAHAKTEGLVSLVRERLSSGSLTSPAGDSAADYLRQLEASRPAGSAQAAAAQARERAGCGADHARARRDARRGDCAGPGRSCGSHQLGRQRSRGSGGAAPGLSRAGAAPGAAGPNLQALAAQLQRTRYVPPEYPDRALSNRIDGSVTVQYVVDKKGYTKDVQVIESVPKGVFDSAATDAIRRWRYRPAQYDGQPVEVPVRTRIRFELPSN